MFVPLQRLLLRTRYTRSRADELSDVHGRLRHARRAQFTEEERTLAVELRALKSSVAEALAEVSSCSRCALGKPTPRGVFAGGDCCSSDTPGLFADEEVLALAAGGTTVRDLRAPTTTHAGCAFRGALGCTLTAVDRPERCVRYMCGTLRRELGATRDRVRVEELVAELRATMDRFVALESARVDSVA
ncbi:MAG: hypothetical protein ACKV2T_04000 [Kofleriaceae bacterium]